MKKVFYVRLAMACAAAAVLCWPSIGSQAATSTGNLDVSASIANNCKFAVSTMAFGAYDPVDTNASTPLSVTGTVSLKCTKSASVALTANTGVNGTHATATCATAACTRAMTDGSSNYLDYDLYTNVGHTTVWDTSNSIAYTGTGLSGTVNVYGYIPAGLARPAGAYTDTVVVTATY